MKALKVIGKVLACVLMTVLLLLLLLRLGVTVLYFDFFNHAESEFLIPGLTSAWVPQGFEYLEEEEVYLMCGYMSDDTASRVYVRNKNGDTHYTNLLYADGSPYRKHAGGLCANGDYLYVAGDDGVDVFWLKSVLNGGDALKIGKIVTGHDMAFCSFYNGYLLAGNFYHPETYETPDTHRITTPAGTANTALITIYKANELEKFGVDPAPVAAISIGDKVQGICFTSDDEIVLSTSYSVASSHLYYHRIDTSRQGTIELDGVQGPLLYLASATLTATVTLPPMSEELIYQDGRVHILCESACNKYIYGKLIRGYQVFSYAEEG